jgi:hypothetical protein
MKIYKQLLVENTDEGLITREEMLQLFEELDLDTDTYTAEFLAEQLGFEAVYPKDEHFQEVDVKPVLVESNKLKQYTKRKIYGEKPEDNEGYPSKNAKLFRRARYGIMVNNLLKKGYSKDSPEVKEAIKLGKDWKGKEVVDPRDLTVSLNPGRSNKDTGKDIYDEAQDKIMKYRKGYAKNSKTAKEASELLAKTPEAREADYLGREAVEKMKKSIPFKLFKYKTKGVKQAIKDSTFASNRAYNTPEGQRAVELSYEEDLGKK